MNFFKLSLVATTLALASCGVSSDPGNSGVGTQSGQGKLTQMSSPVDGADQSGVRPVAGPQSTPAAGNEQSAVELLSAFGRAVERGQFDEASVMLAEADGGTWSREKLSASFADLAQRRVVVRQGRIEGAAGSLYYAAPLAVSGIDRESHAVIYEGEAILRRVNNVDGATAEQLHWHFQSISFDRSH